MATSAPVTCSTLARNAGSSTVSVSDWTKTASLSGGARPASSSMSLAVQDSASLKVDMKPSSVVSAESSWRSTIPSARTAAPSHRAMTIHGLRALIRARFSVMDTVLCRLGLAACEPVGQSQAAMSKFRRASIRNEGSDQRHPKINYGADSERKKVNLYPLYRLTAFRCGAAYTLARLTGKTRYPWCRGRRVRRREDNRVYAPWVPDRSRGRRGGGPGKTNWGRHDEGWSRRRV